MVSNARLHPARPLPVFSTIKRAYQLLWMYRALHVRFAWPGFLLVMAGTALPIHRFWGMDQAALTTAMTDMPAGEALPWIGAITAGTIILIAFGASWRRLLLLDTPMTLLEVPKPFRRYLVLIVITNFVISSIMLVMAVTVQAVPAAALPVLVIALGLTLYLILKHMLIYTAALVDAELPWRQAAELMRGNVLRYAAIWGMTILSVVFLNNVVSELLLGLKVDGGTMFGAFAFGAVKAMVLTLTISLTSSVAALAYDYILHGGGPAPE